MTAVPSTPLTTRARSRIGFVIMLIGAAIYVLVSFLLRPHRGY